MSKDSRNIKIVSNCHLFKLFISFVLILVAVNQVSFYGDIKDVLSPGVKKQGKKVHLT